MRRAAALAVVLLVGACRQGAGQPCEVSSDCDDGLVCVLPAGTTLPDGLTCAAKPTDAAGVDMVAAPDLTATVDMASLDAAMPADLTGSADLSAVDSTSTPDLAGHD